MKHVEIVKADVVTIIAVIFLLLAGEPESPKGSVSITLPKDTVRSHVTASSGAVAISVDKRSKVYVDGKAVSLESIADSIREKGGVSAVIHVDASVPFENVVRVLDRVKEAGITETSFIYDMVSPRPPPGKAG